MSTSKFQPPSSGRVSTPIEKAHRLCVEIHIQSTPENRSRAIRALSLVDTVRLFAEIGQVSVYRVASQSDPGRQYTVLCAPTRTGQSAVCSCPDFLLKGQTCKHAIAVLMHRKREIERIDREFTWFMAVDMQNFKETSLQSLTGLSACGHAQADGREGEI
jgi:hypothetical protein